MSLLRSAVEYVPTGKGGKGKLVRNNMLPRGTIARSRSTVGRLRSGNKRRSKPKPGLLPVQGASAAGSARSSSGFQGTPNGRDDSDGGKFMYLGRDLRVGDVVSYSGGNKSMEGVLTLIEQMSDGARVCSVEFENGENWEIFAKDLVFVKRRQFFDNTLKPSSLGGEFMYNGPDRRVGDLVSYTLGNKSMQGVIFGIERRISHEASFKHPKCWIDLGKGEASLILAEDLVLVERPEFFNWDKIEDGSML
mgnify:FL=1